MLSSSHDELSPEAFGNCVSEKGAEGLREEEERGKNINVNLLGALFLNDGGMLLHMCLLASLCVPVWLVYIPTVTAKLLSPVFTGVEPVDSSQPSKHTAMCQKTDKLKSAEIVTLSITISQYIYALAAAG